ncbi:MAG: hypothetical protein ABQ298_04145 [Puniceicoccaceae bacterium]
MHLPSFVHIRQSALLLLLAPLAAFASSPSESHPPDPPERIESNAANPACLAIVCEPHDAALAELNSDVVLQQLSNEVELHLEKAIRNCLVFSPERFEQHIRSLTADQYRAKPTYVAMR